MGLTSSRDRRLALSGAPAPARALADARRDVERARLEYARTNKFFAASAPEYGTPVIYTLDKIGDLTLYDHTRPWQSVPEPPTLIQVPGMPARPLGWIVGQRSLARRLRRTLTTRRSAGAVLTGMGGLGKSSLATSVLTQLVREGWGVVAIVGAFGLADLAREFVLQLGEQQMSGRLTEKGRGWIAALRERNADDDALVTALRGLLAHDPIIILLDNFELNLVPQAGGIPAALGDGASRPATIRAGMQQVMERLVAACDRGALLVTCRYPIDGLDALAQWPLPPLHPGAMRRLLLRLEGLRALSAAELEDVQATLGPHPRVLEFADALVRAEQGAWQEVFGDIRAKMTRLSRLRGDEPPQDVAMRDTSERLAVARRLAAEDVLLDALLATLDDDTRRFLSAVAVFRRGVPGDALDAVAQAVGLVENERWRKQAVRVLQDRTLIAETGPGTRIEASGPRTWQQSWMVHRWTASELHAREPAPTIAHSAAADWWLAPPQLDWSDAAEGVEHFLAAGRFDDASQMAFHLHEYAVHRGERLSALYLSERCIESLPHEHVAYAMWLGTSADLLTQTGNALDAEWRTREAVTLFEGHAARNPDDYSILRGLSVAYNKLGELHFMEGSGELATRFLDQALAIAERIADASPGRSDLQRDLSACYNKLSNLHVILGHVDVARSFSEKEVSIAKRLAEAEPGRSDLQRDLAASYERMAIVEPQRSPDWLVPALAIRRECIAVEPENVIVCTELALALVLRASHSNEEERPRFLREGYVLLRDLQRRGALEARYDGLVAQIGRSLGDQ
jgi:tetratricopeptide (TPR) repeat protein